MLHVQIDIKILAMNSIIVFNAITVRQLLKLVSGYMWPVCHCKIRLLIWMEETQLIPVAFLREGKITVMSKMKRV